ncbi:MAG: PEP-CTERM sorting domain-containing protein, partial [Planctomycetes bacterium]|nr:PEP-CTERM sorting domain-containing protein [Planctomycetota bacterium]
GDLDHDGDVDIFDWAIFQPNYGKLIGAVYDEGDLDEDGDVDIFDWAIFQPMYGYDTNSPVPEPVTGALLGAGLAGLMAGQRRQSRRRKASESDLKNS